MPETDSSIQHHTANPGAKADTTASGYVYYAPAYPAGLTDTAATSAKVKQLQEYPLIEIPAGKMPEHYQNMPVRSSGVLLLLVFSFLLVAFCYRTGRKYFHNIFSNIWSVKRIKNHLDDHTATETITMVALLVQTIIMEGIILFCAISTYAPEALPQSISKGVAAVVVCTAAYYIAQLLVLRLIGYVFAQDVETELWVKGFNATQSIMGQILAPIAIVMLFIPEHNELMLFFAISLYIIARLLFLLKSFRIFFNSFFQCFYFILYLCAVEIIPLIIVYRGIFLTY